MRFACLVLLPPCLRIRSISQPSTKNRGSDELTNFPDLWETARMTKARSQRAEVGKFRRSDIFVVSHATQIISPVGAASSGAFSDDAAPERSLEGYWGSGSTNMSALTGLAPSPYQPLPIRQSQYRLDQAQSGQVRLGQVKNKKTFLPCRFQNHSAIRLVQPDWQINPCSQINPFADQKPTDADQKMKSPLDSSCEATAFRAATPTYLHLFTAPLPPPTSFSSRSRPRIWRPLANLTGQKPADWTGKLNKK
jgi:hypothetical protein